MTEPQIVAGYADDGIVLTYRNHHILLTPQGAADTAASLRTATRDTAMIFGANDIAMVDPGAAAVLADHIDRAVTDFDQRHRSLINAVDEAMSGGDDQDGGDAK